MDVIALSSYKASGKSTIADWLVAQRGYTRVSLASRLKKLAAHFFPRTLTEQDLYGPSEVRERLFSPADKRRAAIELQAAITWLRLDPDGKTVLTELFGEHDPDRNALTYLTMAFESADECFKSPRTILQRMGTEWGRRVWDEVWLDAVRRMVLADASKKYVIDDCRFPNEAIFLKQKIDARVYWIDSDLRLGERPKDSHASEPTREAMLPHTTGVIENNAGLEKLYELLAKTFP